MAIVSLACTSCSSEGTLAYYTIEPKVALHSSGATDVSAIDAAYGDRASKQYATEKQARSEWNAFINAVDDKAVVRTTNSPLCSRMRRVTLLLP